MIVLNVWQYIVYSIVFKTSNFNVSVYLRRFKLKGSCCNIFQNRPFFPAEKFSAVTSGFSSLLPRDKVS